jgi:hypothetical protein
MEIQTRRIAGAEPDRVTTAMLTKRVDLLMDRKEQESLAGFERAPVPEALGLRQIDSQAKPDRLNRP